MGKFDELVDRPWTDLTLYAESIPHLLHWDLAYLWILEKQQAVRPDKWKERIEAWKYLVSLLLMDKLIIDEVPIEEPLIDYTKPFGLESVSWVKIAGIEKAVGVLSPTVLVRPLPDYRRTQLDRWQSALPDPVSQNLHDVTHLLQLAVSHLNQQPEDSFAARLAVCIRKEFNPLPIGGPPNAKQVHFPFLDRLSWSHRNDEPRLRRIGVFVRAEGDQGNLWIPRCEKCDALLTRSEAEAVVVIESDALRLNCSVCGRVNELKMSDFLVWLRDGQQAILWRRDGITSAPLKGFPPVPTNTGSDLEFRWNPGPLGGEMTRRFLKLKFPGRTVLDKSISELSYPNILVPGVLSAKYKGLPFRSNWLDAVSNIEELSAEVDSPGQRLTYRNVQIKGLPVEVDIRFGSLSIKADEGASVAMYPDPNRMPVSWKTYRTFLNGSRRSSYVIKCGGSRSILPWIAEFTNGAPTAFSVESPDSRTGVCFYSVFPIDLAQGTIAARRELNVGVDFGTTNTLIYVAPPNSNSSDIHPAQFAVQPSKLLENILWFAGENNADAGNNTTGDFLPSKNHGESRTDRYLIPTAVWELNRDVLVRWNSTAPVPGIAPTGNFKSKPEAESLRLAYLRELMFLTIPDMIKRAETLRSEIKLNLGFAFPLTFGSKARQRMNELLAALSAELVEGGCEADCFSISESLACVRAFGTPALHENFLVADMGGGTLDLALFTTSTDNQNLMHQIGSLGYAGEDYVMAFAKRRHAEAIHVWRIRDEISSGESWGLYGHDPDAQRTLEKFVGFAFEYLRTMLLAFSKGQGAAIKLVLVGNGWHLADAFSPEIENRGAPRVFKESYEHLVEKLAVPGLKLSLEDPLKDLPSSKHLVVIGALRNAWGGQGVRELNSNQSQLSRLPSGRGMQLGRAEASHKRFEWSALVGEDIPLIGFSRADLTADSAFFLDEMPPLVEPWRQHFLNLFDGTIAYATEAQIRNQVYGSIQGNPAKIGKGPLHVILEQSWKKKL